MSRELGKLGGKIKEYEDGLIVEGSNELRGAELACMRKATVNALVR